MAGLFNKLLEAELGVTGSENDSQKRALAFWKASFVEDADELHLCTKRIFVPAIRDWLDEEAVKAAFIAGAIGGEKRLARLLGGGNELGAEQIVKLLQARAHPDHR